MQRLFIFTFLVLFSSCGKDDDVFFFEGTAGETGEEENPYLKRDPLEFSCSFTPVEDEGFSYFNIKLLNPLPHDKLYTVVAYERNHPQTVTLFKLHEHDMIYGKNWRTDKARKDPKSNPESVQNILNVLDAGEIAEGTEYSSRSTNTRWTGKFIGVTRDVLERVDLIRVQFKNIPPIEKSTEQQRNH
jgi:hypothetical protein